MPMSQTIDLPKHSFSPSLFALTLEGAFQYSEKDSKFVKLEKFAVGTILTTTACIAAIVETVISSLITILTFPLYPIAPKRYAQITQHTADSARTIIAAVKRTFGAEIIAKPLVKQTKPVKQTPPPAPIVSASLPAPRENIQPKTVEKLPEPSQNFASRVLHFPKEHKTLMMSIVLGTATLAATVFFMYYMKTTPSSTSPPSTLPVCHIGGNTYTSTGTALAIAPSLPVCHIGGNTHTSTGTALAIAPSLPMCHIGGNTYTSTGTALAIAPPPSVPPFNAIPPPSNSTVANASSNYTWKNVANDVLILFFPGIALGYGCSWFFDRKIKTFNNKGNIMSQTVAVPPNHFFSLSRFTSRLERAQQFSKEHKPLMIGIALGTTTLLATVAKTFSTNIANQPTASSTISGSILSIPTQATNHFVSSTAKFSLCCLLAGVAYGIARYAFIRSRQNRATQSPGAPPPPAPLPPSRISPTTGLIITTPPAARSPASPTRSVPPAARAPAPPAGRVLAAPGDILAQRAAILGRRQASASQSRQAPRAGRLPASPIGRTPVPPTRAAPAAGRPPPTTPSRPPATRPPAPPTKLASPPVPPIRAAQRRPLPRSPVTPPAAPPPATRPPAPLTRLASPTARPPAPPTKLASPTARPPAPPTKLASPAARPPVSPLEAAPPPQSRPLPTPPARPTPLASEQADPPLTTAQAPKPVEAAGASSGRSSMAVIKPSQAKGAKLRKRSDYRPFNETHQKPPSGGRGKSFQDLVRLMGDDDGLKGALDRLAPEGSGEETATFSGDPSEESGSVGDVDEFGDLANLAAGVDIGRIPAGGLSGDGSRI